MMNRWAIPLVFVIVAFIGVACGSSSDHLTRIPLFQASLSGSTLRPHRYLDPTPPAETAGSYRHADTQSNYAARTGRPYCYPGD